MKIGLPCLALPITLTLLPARAGVSELVLRAPPQAAASRATDVQFESLGQGLSVEAVPNAPILFVASGVDDLSAFLPLLPARREPILRQTDFSSYLLLAVFWVPGVPAVRVRRITIEGGQFRVVVAPATPGPSPPYRLMSRQRVPPRQEALPSPYDLVRIARTAIGNSIPLSWVLLDAEERVLTTGGVPSAGLLFQSLGQEAPVGPGPTRPTLFLASSPGELSAFLHFLSDRHQAVVSRVDFSTYVVLGVFRGAIGSGGHAITIRRVSNETGQLQVVVALRSPAPGAYAVTAFTSPYQVVQIRREAFGETIPSAWVLLDTEGRVLARSEP